MALVTSHCFRIHSLVTSSCYSSNSKSKRKPTACSEKGFEIQLGELTDFGDKTQIAVNQFKALRRRDMINFVRQLSEYLTLGWRF